MTKDNIENLAMLKEILDYSSDRDYVDGEEWRDVFDSSYSLIESLKRLREKLDSDGELPFNDFNNEKSVVLFEVIEFVQDEIVGFQGRIDDVNYRVLYTNELTSTFYESGTVRGRA